MRTAAMQNLLHQFVLMTCQDPTFRRRLRYHPKETLEAAGFPGQLAPTELPVKHYTVSVFLDASTLFGLRDDLAAGQLLADQISFNQIPIELKLALYGAKPLSMVHGQEDRVNILATWARAHGLVAMLSPNEFMPCEDETKGGYVNQVTQCYPARAGSGHWRRLLVSRSSQHVMLGWLSLLFGWDHLLGRLFGYPVCCTKSFDTRWITACDRHQGDVASLVLQEQQGEAFVGCYSWQTNMLGRYFGAEIISHFPCDFHCPATTAVANRLYSTYHHFEPEAAIALQRALIGTYIYSQAQGVFYFPEAELSGAERSEDGVTTLAIAGQVPQATTVETELFRALAAGDHITCKGSVLSIDGEVFDAQMISFTNVANSLRSSSESASSAALSQPASVSTALDNRLVAVT